MDDQWTYFALHTHIAHQKGDIVTNIEFSMVLCHNHYNSMKNCL